MLEILKIKNFAIIDTTEIHFKKGLNILSGETGAGKSIVIEAIALLLGSRVSVESIRSGCEEAVIEGLFSIGDVPWLPPRLLQFGFDHQVHELLIKRTVHRAGKHRISVNGELATLSTLQKLCEGLIDLCGQHEHQSLVKPLLQLELLDRFGGLSDATRNLSQTLSRYRTLAKERETLQKAEHERTKRSDFLKFQIDEIQSAELSPGEDDQLHQEKSLLQSAEARVQAADSVRQILESEENGILNSLRICLQKLRHLQTLDPKIQLICDTIERGAAECEEASLSINRYLNNIELDPERLQSVQERLSIIADLRRKYGASIEEILLTKTELEKEFSALTHVSERIVQVEHELEAQKAEALKEGKRLSQSRKEVKEALSKAVTHELKDLKMTEAKFHIELHSKDNIEDWTQTGGDAVQFMVQTNAGESAGTLGKIASGGELSRLMLAIRRVISDRGGIGVYLFDEIDSGIGGQTAFQVGKKLKSVAAYNQVICITHLPQVASFADHHLVVQKYVQGKRTITDVLALDHEKRKEELARMLGGPELTKRSLENASELMELATDQV